jgi:hypothetical protein
MLITKRRSIRNFGDPIIYPLGRHIDTMTHKQDSNPGQLTLNSGLRTRSRDLTILIVLLTLAVVICADDAMQ